MIKLSVIALLCLQLSSTSAADAVTQERAEREDALRWASEHRAVIFDDLFPAASDDVSMPVCRMTTIRSSGSLDTFEFMIRIVEDCPVVDPPTGRIAPAVVRGTFVVPEGSPLSDQLATLRLSDPALTPDAAITRIKLRTISVSSGQARRLLKELESTSASLLPPVEIALDARMYEVKSSTGIQTRLAMFAERSSSRRDREVSRVIHATLSALGYGPKKLAHDPCAWSASAPRCGNPLPRENR